MHRLEIYGLEMHRETNNPGGARAVALSELPDSPRVANSLACFVFETRFKERPRSISRQRCSRDMLNRSQLSIGKGRRLRSKYTVTES